MANEEPKKGKVKIESLEIIYDYTSNSYNRQLQRITKHESTAKTLVNWIIVIVTYFLSAIVLAFYNGWRPNNYEWFLLALSVLFYGIAIFLAYRAASFQNYKDVKIDPDLLESYVRIQKRRLLGGLVYYIETCYSHNENIIAYRINRMIYSTWSFIIAILISISILIYSGLNNL